MVVGFYPPPVLLCGPTYKMCRGVVVTTVHAHCTAYKLFWALLPQALYAGTVQHWCTAPAAYEDSSCAFKVWSLCNLSASSLSSGLSSAHARSSCDAPGGRGLQKQSMSAKHSNVCCVALLRFSSLARGFWEQGFAPQIQNGVLQPSQLTDTQRSCFLPQRLPLHVE